MTDRPTPGWYADPSGEHARRYWDGSGWTEQIVDVPATGTVFDGPGSGTLIPCPSCGQTVSDKTPSCPECGYPVNATKSAATMVLVFGILSLVPVYGFIFGILAWVRGNKEIREIDSGLRMPRGRRKARAGRRLGILGIVVTVGLVTWAAATIDPDEVQSAGDEPPAFLAENGIAFKYPDNWEPARDFDGVPYPVEFFAVTPDSASYAHGNWMAITYFPTEVAAESDAAEETFAAHLANTTAEDGRAITLGPNPIELAGIRGLEAHGEGRGERTGNPLNWRIVILFGEEGSYWFTVLFHSDERDVMLSAWEKMLGSLQLQDVSATDVAAEYDQQLIADFEDGSEPFETGRGPSGTLSVHDGAYRAEVVPGPGLHSYAGFRKPNQAITIVADGIQTDGWREEDQFGVGCVNQHYGYSARVSGSGLVEILVISDEQEELLFIDQLAQLPPPGELRQLTITCSVDTAGSGSIAVAVNGQLSARITHEDPRINYLTAVELVFISADENTWSIEIDRITAEAPA